MRWLPGILVGSCAWAQGIVTTVAGTDYLFPDDGKPALQAHLSTPYGLAFDKQGNLYISDGGLNMILKMDTAGVVSIVAGNGLARFAGDGGPARAASLSTPWGIALDASGNLYVADSGNSRVRRIDTSGVISTVAGGGSNSGDGGQARSAFLNQPAAVAFDLSGNLLIAERNGLRVRSVDRNGLISTIAGNGQFGFNGDGGPATSATLQAPAGLAVAADGSFFIADTNNSRVRKVLPNGTITTFAGGGTDPNGTGGPATAVALNRPSGVALDGSGNLYIVEDSGMRARRVSPQGILTNLTGNGTAGFSGDGGPAIAAKVNSLFAVALDPAGNIFLADRLNGRVRRIDTGGAINTIAGVGRFLGDGGPAVNAVLAGPDKSGIGSIAVDPQGNLYIADTAAERVRKIGLDGQINTVAGNGFLGTSPDGTQAANALLSDPAGVAADALGNLIIGDANSNSIRRVSPAGVITTLTNNAGFPKIVTVDAAGNIYFSSRGPLVVTGGTVKKISPTGAITTVAGTGNPGFSGDGGPATSANFTDINGLAVDAAGNLYIADTANQRVRRVDTKGIITTVAGNGQNGDTGDGSPAISAPLSMSWGGVAVDLAGNLYISTQTRIRRVTTDGIIHPWAGTGKLGFSGDGGPAAAAAFADAANLAITPQGNLYVWDVDNRRIRLIQASGGPSIVASQKGLTFIASAGGGSPAPQAFSIVNGGTGALNWGVSASTLSGGNWLAASPASGSSTAGNAGPPVQVSVNPTGLAVGDYYGQIQIQASAAPNSPQSITIVLSVRAPGSGTGSIVQPSGLLFTSATPQSLTLTTLSTAPVTFSGTASFGGASWFTLSPASGTTVSGKPAGVQIVPSLAGLAPGVYNGNITFAFGDSSIQNVQLLLVLTSPQSNAPGVRPAGCTPSKLLPLFTSIGSGFSITTGWPSPVELRVVDDCGTPLTRGTVNASFSNSDPSLSLNSLGDGRWTGTWTAQGAASTVSVTATAQAVDKSLTGTAQVTGGLNKNANPPPVVAAGGVLNAASYQLNSPIAPGSLVAIFGSLLAQGSVSAAALPLANTLAGTTVTIAGRTLPLLFAGPTQVNAMIPYDLPIDASHQVVVQRGTALSNPETIGVLSSQSGVFTKDLTGQGPGIVVRVTADGTQSVVSSTNPAHAYEALIIYCAGLGDVDPRQIAGQPVPFSPLSTTLDAVSVTIGGIDAPVFFAGLTPGFTGLYQVNAYVPTGVTPGDNVPLVITQAGRVSPPVTISVR